MPLEPQEYTALNIKDALRIAAKDELFAAQLISNPGAFQAPFNLNEKEVTHLKELGRAALIAVRGVTNAAE